MISESETADVIWVECEVTKICRTFPAFLFFFKNCRNLYCIAGWRWASGSSITNAENTFALSPIYFPSALTCIFASNKDMKIKLL